MTRLSSLIFLSAASLALASPALAKGVSVPQGETLCKAEAQKVHSAKSVRIDQDETKATSSTLTYNLRVKAADDSSSLVRCTIDRDTKAIVLAAAQ